MAGIRRACLPLFVAGALSGCKTRLSEFVDCTIPAEAAPRITTSCRQAQPRNKVDVLVMVDNSTSMDPMQEELRQRFPQFLKVFHDLAGQGIFFDLHIGVVTSDYGAGSTGTGGCEPSPGGQKGKLQAIGQFAAPGCKAPTDANFIQYVFDPNGQGPNNLPMGQSLDQTFTCMATVGARGCGMEHQLESVYAALHGDIPENAGFLRDDALLAVLWLTNEDDCSAPPDTDLFDVTKSAKYGFSGGAGYRCPHFGIVCGNPPSPPPYQNAPQGPLNMCVPAPNPNDMGPGKLFDIGRYVDFYSHPALTGGVKFDPNDVLLVGIAAPPQPFDVILADPNTGNDGKPYKQCAVLDDQGNPPCVPTLQHSCQNPDDGAFFGDPAVRLATVIDSVPNHGFSSICDADYSGALDTLARLIVSQSGQCCLPERLPPDPRSPSDPTRFVADCTVTQVTRNADGSTTSTEIPECVVGGPVPCWQIEEKGQCQGLSPQSFGVTVERGGAAPPPHTTTQATCTTAGK